jgi:MFS transporter, DHA1 family, inner membrane transport protein
MLLRVLTLTGAAIFTPQAAAAAGAMVPGNGRAAAVATVFIGWSIASVAGVPLGTWLGTRFGWRIAMLAVALIAVLVAVLVHLVVPRKVSTPPLPLSTFGEVARHATLPRILLVTLIQATAMFTLFAYIAPVVQATLGSLEPVSLVLAALGVAGVVGNAWAVKLLPRWGAPRTVTTAIVSMALGAALLPLGQGSTWLFCLLAAAWGLGGFATNSSQQARLATTAPPLTPASVAMNTSAIYLGQAAGALVGGLLVSHGLPVMVAVSVAVYLLAAAVSHGVGDHRAAR